MKNRMILVSNRLPVTAELNKNNQRFILKKSSGGLVTGLREIHNDPGCLWVGHCGLFQEDSRYQSLKAKLSEERLIAVDLPKSEYEDFYCGASNNEIWPLFHYFPDYIESAANNWPAYEYINQEFAKKILSLTKPGDQIWVHDYQLMYLPALLRNANPELSIAYFHHIPFPSFELFRILQARTAILTGLLGADLIGFHTYDYVRHFIQSVTRLLGNSAKLDEILYQNRRIKVIAQPLGVDIKSIKKSITKNHQQQTVLQLAREIGNRTVLLGIDRLDYTKGLPQRLMAFRQLLHQFPEHIGKVILIQICVPTRSDILRYIHLRAEVEQLVGQINGEFGAPGYTPVQYLYRSFNENEIMAFYRLARIAIVTPLRDGLNLVCKEYVAVREDEDGILILSEMAGAAAEMGEALLINPYDINQFTQALHQGLTMDVKERHQRLAKLRARIIKNDNIFWLQNFIQNWQATVKRNHTHSVLLQVQGFNNLINRIEPTKRCFIFLDYEVTLAPGSSQFDQSTPSLENVELIDQLASIEQLEFTLLTHRSRDFCNDYFVDLPINIIAEQGTLIQLYRDRIWQTPLETEEFSVIKDKIMDLLQVYTQQVPGAYIEAKQFSLTWHYQQCEPIFGEARARELVAAIAQLLENTLFGAFHHNKMLSIRPLITNKGYAVGKILQHQQYNTAQDTLFTLGNDETDETMYQISPQNNIAIHVGAPNLFAKYHLNSVTDVHTFLKKMIATARAKTY
ncbi:MAG: bifunctional alpha,alpha-trehalose-phosphate synthase (UDP-forming)/trehalose-phosphatase [Proteobacteria bacterium]|nr:bifunctional alpha,alpha-trehalose-phosphate synthase (UDP-forming)/trehalose-phosphatase [Pseudomonadota bacterium]